MSKYSDEVAAVDICFPFREPRVDFAKNKITTRVDHGEQLITLLGLPINEKITGDCSLETL